MRRQSDPRGEITDEVVDGWLVHLARCADGDKSVKNERSFEKTSSKFADLEWYSKETLATTFGTNRSKFWLDDELLPRSPCRISGKHGEWITEFAVPNDWERLTEADLRRLRGEVEFALSEAIARGSRICAVEGERRGGDAVVDGAGWHDA